MSRGIDTRIANSAADDAEPVQTTSQSGPVGRLGVWSFDHRRLVALVWLVVAVALGMLAPRVEHALSGAGWEATGSESVAARDVIDREFSGLGSSALQVVVTSDSLQIGDETFDRSVERVTEIVSDHEHVSRVVAPIPESTIARDGRTVVLQGGAGADPDDMVRAAADIGVELEEAGLHADGDDVRVLLTGSSAMWADFNRANRDAMLKSEIISWPVTLAIMVLAFGSLVAAGLPLLLTIMGLVATAGSLVLIGELADVSIWAMNFAMMFALALGIDYALFIVHRFRGALLGSALTPREAVAQTMDTAGKAVVFSALTVFISLSAVLLVPSPAFRSMSLGIMLAVAFVLLATMTLLPALLGSLGPRIDRLALPWHDAGTHRSPRFERWAQHIWTRPIRYALLPTLVLVLLAVPVARMDTGMPSIKVVPQNDSSRLGYDAVQDAFGDGAPGALSIVVDASRADEAERKLGGLSGIRAVMPAGTDESGRRALLQLIPTAAPSTDAMRDTIDDVRAAMPAGTLVGGATAEQHDLENVLGARTLLVFTIVLTLGFVLLLVALQAPLIALAGVLTNLLASGAAFGLAVWLFQDERLVRSIGIEPQGYLNAWAPVFFFAMVFAISMDYTVFLLSSAKEHYDRGEGARAAMVGGLAHSGRVILAAGAVMVAVFFTFALQGPLPPREMGIILGLAVLLDALIVRLVLVPALLALLGERAWACPRWLRRILPDVRFGH